jgi:hypothetical protein
MSVQALEKASLDLLHRLESPIIDWQVTVGNLGGNRFANNSILNRSKQYYPFANVKSRRELEWTSSNSLPLCRLKFRV